MTKYTLHVTPGQRYYTSFHVYLWSPENDKKENKMGNIRHAFTKTILHIFAKKLHSKLPSHLFKKEDGGLRGLLNNFAYDATKLVNLYWSCVGWPQQLYSTYRNTGKSVLETLPINQKILMKYLRLKFFLAVI